jgi:hypothetical protein
MSSFNHKGCDVPFLVNRMYGLPAEQRKVNAGLVQNLVMQEANWAMETFLGSVCNKQALSRLQVCVLFTFCLLFLGAFAKLKESEC